MEELCEVRPGRVERSGRGTAQWGRYRLAADSVEALRAVGMFGTVEKADLRDLFESPARASRALADLGRSGLLRVEGFRRGGRGLEAVTLTRDGKRLLEREVDPRDAGDLDAQSYRSATARPSQVLHDTAVYRAARRECKRIEALGGRIERIRTDSDLRRIVDRIADEARESGSSEERSRSRAAAALGLAFAEGKLTLPDVRIECCLPDAIGDLGERKFVDVEVATRDYREAALRAKAEAGFRIHAMDIDGSLRSWVAGGRG